MGPQIELLVINLDRAEERLKMFMGQPAISKFAVHRLAAQDGKEKKFRATFDHLNLRVPFGYAACFQSHLNAWNYVALSDKPLLILEDDAVLDQSTDWETFLDRTVQVCVSANLGVLQLGFLTGTPVNEAYVSARAFSRRRFRADTPGKSFRIGKYPALVGSEFRSGGHAYVLFPRAARILLAMEPSRLLLFDVFLDTVAASPLYWDQVAFARLGKSKVIQRRETQTNAYDPELTAWDPF
jgi:GR25 family glycosyltransferase involved in LPS biosynthesis